MKRILFITFPKYQIPYQSNFEWMILVYIPHILTIYQIDQKPAEDIPTLLLLSAHQQPTPPVYANEKKKFFSHTRKKKFIFSLSSCVKLVEAAWFFFALLEEAQKKGRAREKRALKNGLFFVMASFASRFCFSPKVSFLFYVSHWRVQVLFWRYGSIVRCHIQGQKIV